MTVLLAAGLLAACGGGGGSGGSSNGNGGDSAANSGPPPAASLSDMARLGQTLFADTRLSASGQQSCATCHVASRAYAGDDGLSAPLGGADRAQSGLRNGQALTYAQYAPAFSFDSDGAPSGGFFRDGRSLSLADQATKPFLTPFEMANGSADEVLARLLTRPYLDQFKQVFGADAVRDGATALQNIGFALAQYEKEDASFHPFDSKYDAFLKGQATLDAQELNGLALFNNAAKGNCTACHSATPAANTPALFTDFSYDNIGIPRNWKIPANVSGNPLPAGIEKNGALSGAVYDYYDLGLCGPVRADLAASTSLCGGFKVPSLRNVALTAPYFHNGVFETLEEAVAWYITRDTQPARWFVRADGTPDDLYNDTPEAYRGNVNQAEVPYLAAGSPRLTDAEIADVVRFLCTLTDGYDPAHPENYRIPAQCHATAASVAATLAAPPSYITP
jgi:cytochrome c peroxidase